MRPVHCLIALAIFCPSVATVVWAEEPTPPQQGAPWAPPQTRLPRFLVTASRILFDQGLADPRGCEYRSIRVEVGDFWGVPSEVVTTGWVLPAANGEPGHAVAWNGLVYPLAGVGEPADLAADVQALGVQPPVDRPAGQAEIASVALDSLQPIHLCLLLRLGRADLAEALWSRAGRPLAPKPTGPGPEINPRSYGVSYVRLAADFARSRFNRALSAHLAGDDPRALADLRALDAFWKAVDAKAAEMGFLPRPADTPGAKLSRASRHLDFLDQAPALLADQERRAGERANPAPPAPEGDKITPLIRALDQIGGAAGRGLFGETALDQSPTFRALIALGDEAVDPLIQTLRSDDRLTRALEITGGFDRGRTIMTVDRAAFAALAGILKIGDFAPPTLKEITGEPVDRKALADRIEAYWRKNRGVPLTERWYRTLADDQVGADAWVDAAMKITWPEELGPLPGEPGAAERAGPLALAETSKLRGEPLRRDHEPTVTALMTRRLESMLAVPESQNPDIPHAMQMAKRLATWDPAAATATLRDLTGTTRERFAQAQANHVPAAARLGLLIAELTSIRAQAGDPAAIRDYVEWIKTTSFDSVEPLIQGVLNPLRLHPDDPNLAAAADWLLGAPQSPWASLWTDKGAKPAQRLGRLIAAPLIKAPAFRKLLARALADRTPIGTAEVDGDDHISARFDDGGRMGRLSTGETHDPDPPPIGARAPLRARDFLAWLLASQPDAPHFNPCWPEPRRDAAVAEIIEFLKREKL